MPHDSLRALMLSGLLLFGAACDELGEPVPLERMEQSIREQPGRTGKVGTLRGLEIAASARARAGQFAMAAEAACEMPLLAQEPAVTYVSSLQITRTGARSSEVSWHEERELRHDASRSWHLDVVERFHTEIQQAGGRRWQWHIKGGTLSRTEEGVTVVEQGVSGATQERLIVGESVAALQLLLDAADAGWQRLPAEQPETARWKIGGQRLRCVSGAWEESAWAARLAARATFLDGGLTVIDAPRGHRQRRFRGRWRLETGAEIAVQFRDELASASDVVALPAATGPSSTVDPHGVVEREDLLRQWTDDGWLVAPNTPSANDTREEPAP